MKSMFRAALAAALLTGVGSVALVTPAMAKEKKDDAAKGPALKLSKEVLEPAQAAQKALAAKDYATAGTSIAAIEAAAKTDDDRYIAAALKLQMQVGQLQGGQGDARSLNPALDTLIANPKTPQADKAKYAYQRGKNELAAKNYSGALTFLQQAQQLGETDPNLPLQIVQLRMESGDVANGQAELAKSIDAQVAAGQKPDESLYRYALSKTVQKKMVPESVAWIKRYLAAYPTPKNLRDMLFIYGIQQGSLVTLDKAQKVDLFRLLRGQKSLADQFDYEIYAQYTIDLGLPYEGKSVLQEGKAAGKVPADSATANDLMALANKSISNEGSLAPLEAKAKAGANGKLAAGTADAYLGMDNYAKAIDLYKVALQKGSVDADAVNTHLGIALTRSGDAAGAKAAFEQVKTAPRADIAAFWTSSLAIPAGAAPATTPAPGK